MDKSEEGKETENSDSSISITEVLRPEEDVTAKKNSA
jgi:hypothetical protein